MSQPRTVLTSRNERLMNVLALEPERRYSPVELASVLGCTTQQAASACWHLWRDGKVKRHITRTGGLRQSTYQHNDGREQ